MESSKRAAIFSVFILAILVGALYLYQTWPRAISIAPTPGSKPSSIVKLPVQAINSQTPPPQISSPMASISPCKIKFLPEEKISFPFTIKGNFEECENEPDINSIVAFVEIYFNYENQGWEYMSNSSIKLAEKNSSGPYKFVVIDKDPSGLDLPDGTPIRLKVREIDAFTIGESFDFILLNAFSKVEGEYLVNSRGELVKQSNSGSVALVEYGKDIKPDFEIGYSFENGTTTGKRYPFLNGKVMSFWLSPDGKYIAYTIKTYLWGCCASPPTHAGMSLMIMNSDGSNKRPIVLPENRMLGYFGWLYDSRHFVLNTFEGGDNSGFIQDPYKIADVDSLVLKPYTAIDYSGEENPGTVTAGYSLVFSGKYDLMAYRKGGYYGTAIVVSKTDGSNAGTVYVVPSARQIYLSWNDEWNALDLKIEKQPATHEYEIIDEGKFWIANPGPNSGPHEAEVETLVISKENVLNYSRNGRTVFTKSMSTLENGNQYPWEEGVEDLLRVIYADNDHMYVTYAHQKGFGGVTLYRIGTSTVKEYSHYPYDLEISPNRRYLAFTDSSFLANKNVSRCLFYDGLSDYSRLTLIDLWDDKEYVVMQNPNMNVFLAGFSKDSSKLIALYGRGNFDETSIGGDPGLGCLVYDKNFGIYDIESRTFTENQYKNEVKVRLDAACQELGSECAGVRRD